MAESTADLTVEILRQIRDQLAKTDERVEKLGGQVGALAKQQTETNELMKVLVGSHSKLNEKVDVLTQRVDVLTERVDSTNARLDRLTEETIKGRTQDAARFLDHDERLARIEKHLGLQGH